MWIYYLVKTVSPITSTNCNMFKDCIDSYKGHGSCVSCEHTYPTHEQVNKHSPDETRTHIPTDKWTHFPTNKWTHIPTDKWTHISTDKRTHISTDKWTPIHTDKWTPIHTDKWTHIHTDKWMHVPHGVTYQQVNTHPPPTDKWTHKHHHPTNEHIPIWKIISFTPLYKWTHTPPNIWTHMPPICVHDHVSRSMKTSSLQTIQFTCKTLHPTFSTATEL